MAPTWIYVEIVHYIEIVPLAQNLDLRRNCTPHKNCPAGAKFFRWHLGIISFWRQLRFTYKLYSCPYVENVLLAPRNLFPFGASSDLPWGLKSPEIPSRVFLFAFGGALELIPVEANSNLRWNCPAGTLELITFGTR